MKLSTRGRYGVRALLELAMGYKGGPIPINKLAERQEISAKYLEQLLIPLKAAGLGYISLLSIVPLAVMCWPASPRNSPYTTS